MSSRASSLAGSRASFARDLEPLSELAREVEARLCSLHRLAEALHVRVEETRQEAGTVNITKLEERSRVIAVMRRLHSELQRLTAVVGRNGVAADALHNAEIKAAQEGLHRAQAADPKKEELPPRPPPPQPQPQPQLAMVVRQRVPVVGDIAIEALVMPDGLKRRDEVYARVAPGGLYYIPSWNHFAFRIGPCVLHGNLGQVYDAPREAPERVKACRRDRCKGGPGCRYYHDPAEFLGSSDVRNYAAGAWA
jgi:hypothetical protein